MGKITRRGNGDVTIQDVTFNALDADPILMQQAVDIFGGFFARAMEREMVTVTITLPSEKIQMDEDSPVLYVATAPEVHFGEWEGHRVIVVDERSEARREIFI